MEEKNIYRLDSIEMLYSYLLIDLQLWIKNITNQETKKVRNLIAIMKFDWLISRDF